MHVNNLKLLKSVFVWFGVGPLGSWLRLTFARWRRQFFRTSAEAHVLSDHWLSFAYNLQWCLLV